MIRETDKAGLEELIKTSPVPVLADFYATWCGSCKTMEKVLEEFDKANSDRVSTVRIDAEKESEFSASIGVETLPTIILYKDGEEYIRVRGGRTRAELERLLTL